MKFSPDDAYLAFATSDGISTIPNTLSTTNAPAFLLAPSACCITFHRETNLFAAGGSDGAIRLYSLYQRQLIRELRGHLGSIHSICCHSDGQLLVRGARDNPLLESYKRAVSCYIGLR